jgi:replication factor A2
LTLVAHVVSIIRSETNCNYVLEDGFGRFDARRWVDSNTEEDDAKWGDIRYTQTIVMDPADSLKSRENQLVRVSGTMRSFGNKKYLGPQHMRPLKDKHEIYYHLLEVAYTQVALERGHVSFLILLMVISMC